MALERYKCSRCGETKLAFEDEFHGPDGNCGVVTRWCHMWEQMPPAAKVVIATAGYMQEYQLDSLATVYELDRILNIEAREEKEMKVFQDYIKNV